LEPIIMASTLWMRLRQRALPSVLFALASGVPGVGVAAIDVQPISNIDFGTWDVTQGNVSASSDFCVVSTAGASGNARDYAVTAVPEISGAFEVAGGGVAIPFTVTFTDLIGGAAEALQPSVRTARDKTGVGACAGAQNARVTIAFSSVDLASAPAGTYQLRIVLSAQNNNGSAASAGFEVRVGIPDQIRISGLDPIDLGSFDGVSDLEGTDSLCVYRNSGGAVYSLLATGDGAGGAFAVSNGVAVVPYGVEYDDGGGFTTLASGVPITASGANTVAMDCGGSPNASVRVVVGASDVNAAAPGAYIGTLTLMVAPQ
jgi:hypothetical protein